MFLKQNKRNAMNETFYITDDFDQSGADQPSTIYDFFVFDKVFKIFLKNDFKRK